MRIVLLRERRELHAFSAAHALRPAASRAALPGLRPGSRREPCWGEATPRNRPNSVHRPASLNSPFRASKRFDGVHQQFNTRSQVRVALSSTESRFDGVHQHTRPCGRRAAGWSHVIDRALATNKHHSPTNKTPTQRGRMDRSKCGGMVACPGGRAVPCDRLLSVARCGPADCAC